MLFTPAQPNELLDWFWNQIQFTFLVLLAAGGIGQARFFREVFGRPAQTETNQEGINKG
jgi:hypothetical protein